MSSTSDDYAQVASAAKDALNEFSTLKLESHVMIEMLEDGLHILATKLSRVVHSHGKVTFDCLYYRDNYSVIVYVFSLLQIDSALIQSLIATWLWEHSGYCCFGHKIIETENISLFCMIIF